MGIAHGDDPGMVDNNACTQQRCGGLGFGGLSVIDVAIQVVIVAKGVVKLDAELVVRNDLIAGAGQLENVGRHVQVWQG